MNSRIARALARIGLAVTLLSLSSSAQTTVWVDSINGDDSFSGTQIAPYKTITQALQTFSPGGLDVKLEPGVFSAPDETFPLVLSSGQNIMGVYECGAVIQNSVFVGFPTKTIVVSSGSNSFADFELRTPANKGIWGSVPDGSSLTLLAENVTFTAAQQGVSLQAQRAALLLAMNACQVDALVDGVRVEALAGGTADIYMNACRLEGGSALHLLAGGAASTLDSIVVNSAFHDSNTGLHTNASGGATLNSTLRSCTFHKNGQLLVPSAFGGGIVDSGGRANHDVQNSIFWNNVQARDMPNYSAVNYTLTTNLVQQASLLIPSSGNITGDPLFMDGANADFHLTLGSAAIDMATAISGSTDADGDPRGVLNTLPHDIGMDEYYDHYIYAVNDQVSPGGTADLRVFGAPGTAFQIHAEVSSSTPAFTIPGTNQLGAGLFLIGSGSIPAGSTHASMSVAIPATPGLTGLPLLLQAVSITPTLDITYNAEQLCIGL